MMPVTSRLGVMELGFAESNVPWKVPLRGATCTAENVPVDANWVQPPASVENCPDSGAFPVGRTPDRLTSWPNSLILSSKVCPFTLPDTGPTPWHPSPGVTLPDMQFPDCTKQPEKDSGAGLAWRSSVMSQLPDNELVDVGVLRLSPHERADNTASRTIPAKMTFP